MISSESNFLTEIIENIPDKQLQREYFKKYLEIQKQSCETKVWLILILMITKQDLKLMTIFQV